MRTTFYLSLYFFLFIHILTLLLNFLYNSINFAFFVLFLFPLQFPLIRLLCQFNFELYRRVRKQHPLVSLDGYQIEAFDWVLLQHTAQQIEQLFCRRVRFWKT